MDIVTNVSDNKNNGEKKIEKKIEKKQIPEDALDSFLLELAKKQVYEIHPRRNNRIETVWHGAVTIQADSLLPDAFKVLIDENILCAPVVTQSSKFYGYLDMMMLVTFVVDLFSPNSDPSRENLALFFEQEERFKKTSVRYLIDLQDNKREVIPKDYSLLHAFEVIVKRDFNLVAIINSEFGDVSSVITRSMLIGWVHNNMNTTLKAISNVPVSVIPASSYVSSIGDDERAIKAFGIIARQKISGVPVVNKFGDIVDFVSMRDLRGMSASSDSFIRLWHNVITFKNTIRSNFPNTIPSFPDLYLLPSDELRTAVKIFEGDRVHRLVVVKSHTDRRPLHILSQIDVLRWIFKVMMNQIQVSYD